MAFDDTPLPLTDWLRDWQLRADGTRMDERLLEAIYADLRRIAAQRLARESQAALAPTELVHEAWLRLKASGSPISDRSSFLRLASVAIRHLLVDQARQRLSGKRHGDIQPITLSAIADEGQRPLDDAQMLDVDRALDAMAVEHPRAAQALSLRAFAGLDLHELADTLHISLATAKRDLAFGRAWLIANLKESSA